MSGILIVDDDPNLLYPLAEFLGSEQLQVYTAASGAEALRCAYHQHPDLVVLDVMMPGMDGWDLTGRLRELSDVPIILLTGRTTEADKLRGFQLGVDDYITKPFSFAELEARIQAVLHRAGGRRAEENSPIRFGDACLNLEKRELIRAGRRVDLTPTEYRLLEALARHIGETVSEESLLNTVWGETLTEGSSTLRRYIWFLRQKIENDPKKPRRILSRRGFGYRLEKS